MSPAEPQRAKSAPNTSGPRHSRPIPGPYRPRPAARRRRSCWQTPGRRRFRATPGFVERFPLRTIAVLPDQRAHDRVSAPPAARRPTAVWHHARSGTYRRGVTLSSFPSDDSASWRRSSTPSLPLPVGQQGLGPLPLGQDGVVGQIELNGIGQFELTAGNVAAKLCVKSRSGRNRSTPSPATPPPRDILGRCDSYP